MNPDGSDSPTLQDWTCNGCQRQNAPDARYCAGCGVRKVRRGDTFDGDGADPLVGRVIADRYKIVGVLGRGGMGVVYKVEHVHIGKLMAMKLLHGELARDRDTVKRFRREAEAASRLSHSNTVQIFDFGRADGLMYLVMEYVQGRDFGTIVKRDGPLPFTRVASICEQVCASVAEAHAAGIVHRDLKPENIMVRESESGRDVVKVLDFGLAKLREYEGIAHASITRAGSVLGTPYYMSPEQIRGENVDHRADIYAMGALMYRAVTGTPVFGASTPMGILTKHLTDNVEPPSKRAAGSGVMVPLEADRILLLALQKIAADRYQSMDELRQALVEYLIAEGELTDSERTTRSTRISGYPTTKKKAEIATRSEIEQYERRLRRRGYFSYLFAAVLLALLVGGATWLYQNAPNERGAVIESEPNNEPSAANSLSEGRAATGYLGQRIDRQHSDADIYALELPAGRRGPVSIHVTGIPNMDIVVDLVRHGYTNPVLVIDNGGVGVAERVPNFPLASARYYLRVRERWDTSAMATENVSDPYQVEWSFVAPLQNDEIEINDSLEQSGPVDLGVERRGFIGWAGDHDTFCVSEDATDVVASVTAIEDMNLALRIVDRVGEPEAGRAQSRLHDDNGVGEGERSPVLPRVSLGETCFVVFVPQAAEGIRASADRPYVLLVAPVADQVIPDAGSQR